MVGHGMYARYLLSAGSRHDLQVENRTYRYRGTQIVFRRNRDSAVRNVDQMVAAVLGYTRHLLILAGDQARAVENETYAFRPLTSNKKRRFGIDPSLRFSCRSQSFSNPLFLLQLPPQKYDQHQGHRDQDQIERDLKRSARADLRTFAVIGS